MGRLIQSAAIPSLFARAVVVRRHATVGPVAWRHPKVRGQVESCGRRRGTKVPKAGWALPGQGGTSGF